MKTENIKFYYNGIKVNGGKLTRCYYSICDDAGGTGNVYINARDYDSLPRDIFDVKNDTDLYTDYFDKDGAILTPEHPLHPYARAAAVKAEIRDLERYNPDRTEKIARYKAELAELPKGQPTAADLAKVDELYTARKNEAQAKREAEEQEARERYQRHCDEGRDFIQKISAEYPREAGAPYVTINWSESPCFSAWKDNELTLSVAAAEIIFKHFDEERAADGEGGYDKTSFTITTPQEDDEDAVYTGRYDLGDNDGGLIAHIRSFGETCRGGEERKQNILAFAAELEGYTAAGRIVSVDIPDSVISFAERVGELSRKRAAEQTAPKNDQQASADGYDLPEWDIYEAVQILTDDQIEHAIMEQVPGENDNIARFFLQELFRRDEKNAMQVFKRWRGLSK